jgi:hypothetical protein
MCLCVRDVADYIGADTMSNVTTTTTTAKPAIAVSIDGTRLTLAYSNGNTAAIDAAMLTDDIKQRAIMHGLKQKIVDAAAISRNPETGRSATIADKEAACDEVITRLLAGDWNKNREGQETGGLLLTALVRLYPAKSRDDLAAFLEKKTDKEKSALRVTPKIAAMIIEIKAERDAGKTAGLDGDALLGELED